MRVFVFFFASIAENMSKLHHSSNQSSLDSFSSLFSLAPDLNLNLVKSHRWLNDLEELHYFPYNSCNSLTIYSYKYWEKENKFLVATKENNLKEVYFKTYISSGSSDDLNIDNTGMVFSARSSVSSTNSNTTNEAKAKAELALSENETNLSSRKNSMINSTMAEDKSTSINDLISHSYLEPVFKIHKFSEITSYS
jgi:hypothetical protein